MGKSKKSQSESQQDAKSNWRPNEIPFALRLYSLVLAALLLAYGISGFLNNKLEIATRKGGGGRLVLYDRPAWLLASSVIVGAILLLSLIVDHYDRRNNEGWYRAFRQAMIYVGLALLAAALVSYVYLALLG
ncbi:MAG: hypothetical protein KF892_24325 [Rhizobacter sp.]|nr:hypothetical protein [Rhizobacter sp.]